MVPINQVILGGDPLLGSSMVGNSLDEQLQLIEKYKQNLEAAKQLRQQVQPVQQPAQHRMIWGILTEMMENLMTTNPFSFKTSFIGDIEIGGGQIKFNLPLTNKRLVLNMSDLEAFKETLITKN